MTPVSFQVWVTSTTQCGRRSRSTSLELACIGVYSTVQASTFYQRNTFFSQSDHDLAAEFRYRVSPHVTVTLRDTLTKNSDPPYHFDPNPIGSATGSLLSPNQSVISPIADTVSNSSAGQITYQFSASGMVGASGTETEQRYLHPVASARSFQFEHQGRNGFLCSPPFGKALYRRYPSVSAIVFPSQRERDSDPQRIPFLHVAYESHVLCVIVWRAPTLCNLSIGNTDRADVVAGGRGHFRVATAPHQRWTSASLTGSRTGAA